MPVVVSFSSLGSRFSALRFGVRFRGKKKKGVEPDPADYKHVKITTGHGLDLLWWNKADQYQTLMDAALVTATITLSTNQFMGNIRP